MKTHQTVIAVTSLAMMHPRLVKGDSFLPAKSPTFQQHTDEHRTNLSRFSRYQDYLREQEDAEQEIGGAIGALASLFQDKLKATASGSHHMYVTSPAGLYRGLQTTQAPTCAPTVAKVKSTKAPSVKKVKSTKAPSVKKTKAPSVKKVKSTKAPSVKKVKSTKAPSVKKVKSTKAPSVKKTKAPSVKKVKSAKCKSVKVDSNSMQIFVANARPKSATENTAEKLVIGQTESFALCLIAVAVAVAAVLMAVTKIRKNRRREQESYNDDGQQPQVYNNNGHQQQQFYNGNVQQTQFHQNNMQMQQQRQFY